MLVTLLKILIPPPSFFADQIYFHTVHQLLQLDPQFSFLLVSDKSAPDLQFEGVESSISENTQTINSERGEGKISLLGKLDQKLKNQASLTKSM